MDVPVIADLRSVLAESEQRVRDFFEQRAPEIEHVAQAASAVAENPLVQAALGAANITPGMTQAFADLLNRLDAELEAAKSAGSAPWPQPAEETPEAGVLVPDPAPADGAEAGPEAVPGE